MKAQYVPEALRKKLAESNPYYENPEWEFLVTRAKECLLFRMSPDYYDTMTMMERHAWITAYNEVAKERTA